MKSHFIPIPVQGRGEPALREAAGTCPRKAPAALAQPKNHLLSVGFPLTSPRHPAISCCRHNQRKLLARSPIILDLPSSSKCALGNLLHLLQLVQSPWMDSLYPQSGKHVVCRILHYMAMQLNPSILQLRTFPWALGYQNLSPSLFLLGQITQAEVYAQSPRYYIILYKLFLVCDSTFPCKL